MSTDLLPSDRPYLTVAETAALLGVHPDTAYDAIGRGELPHYRVGQAIRVPTAPIAAMLGLPYTPAAAAPGPGEATP